MPKWRCCRSLSQQSCHPVSGWTTSKASCWESSQSQQMSAKGKTSQGVANGKKKKKGISPNSCKWPPEGQAKGTELSQSNVNNSIMEKSWSGGSHRSHIWTGMRNKVQMVCSEWWSVARKRSEAKGGRAIPCPPPVSGCPVAHRDSGPGQAQSNTPSIPLELPQSPGYLQTMPGWTVPGLGGEQEDWEDSFLFSDGLTLNGAGNQLQTGSRCHFWKTPDYSQEGSFSSSFLILFTNNTFSTLSSSSCSAWGCRKYWMFNLPAIVQFVSTLGEVLSDVPLGLWL